MATVPRLSNPSVNTNALPNARQAVDINADAFGANTGRQLQQTGAQLNHAADMLTETALREQDQANTDMIFAAEAKLSDQWLEYQTGAAQRRGTQAWGLRNDTEAWFDKAAADLGKDLNPAVKKLFDQRLQQRRISGMEWAASYERQQRDASLEQNLAASLVAAQNEAAANPTPGAVQTGVKNIERNLRATAQIMGWDQTYTDQRILEEQGKLHQAVINNMIEADPRAAQAYYEANKAQIPGTMQDGIGKLVEKSVKVLNAQEYADAAISSGKSETAVLAGIRDKFQGDDEELLVAHVRSRFSERDAAIARAEKANREAVFNAIAEANGDMGKVPPKMLATLDAYDQQSALTYAERLRSNDSTTDWAAYTNFMMLPDAEKAKVDPSTLRAQLGDTEYKQVLGIVDALRNPSKSPTTQTATPTQQINAAADAIGLIGDALTQQRGVFTTKVLNGVEKFKADNKRDPAYGEVQQIIKDVGTELSQVPDFLTPQQKPSAQPTRTVDQQLSVAHDKLGIAGDKKAEERGAFDSLIVGEIDAYRAANGGRDPDYTAVQKVIDRATKETVVTKDWWPDSTVSPLTVEVPAEDRAAISDAFQRKRGRAPSELEVREAYIAKKAAQ